MATVENAPRHRSVGSAKLREALVAYAFILVPMGVFLLFFIWPLAYAVYISRYDWGVFGKIETLGFENYRELYRDEIFHKALKNTLLYTALVVPIQMALGLAMAVIVNAGIRGKTFFRSAFYFPSLASSAAITAIAIYILSADGLLNAIIGGNRPWFGDSDTALFSIVGLNAWTTSGTMMLFYLASLQAIPTDVYEAAAIDRAGAWRTFWKITFPLLKPGHFFVGVVSVVGALKVFDQAFIVSNGSGGPNSSTLTAVLYLYRTAIGDIRFGYAAAMGIVLFVLIFTVTLVQRLLFGRPDTA
ncbi:MAG: sugar ABC transporter permease [Gaiellaceae bacterium MAG52_C11]|nr:sugar ABC transporter permease [Candidatus Gaiellasilicea maunaloa]